ncbi:Ribonuclease III [Thermosinus carboxydivorans Nor1]|uniref:Ribonuclease 3 n=1 Tax=Thermosinus carboxydivorans Nor1 TaxID=401526 RepID=A1HN82_9FIRM|nr:ribonuclease III [Thermosinus carboxydivorans]EAX48708.1 Ribonuclease III [Thermosinus carboxydivorans Nor1]
MAGPLDRRREDALRDLAASLGISFNDLGLLHQALVHTSYANEVKGGVEHNERLEFLGDAVLELIISEYLYRNFPELPEGELTKARARLVCEPSLAQCASRLGLGKYLLLGKGEAVSGGRERTSILADAFEAVIGAIYLDGGVSAATNFVLNHLHEDLALIWRGDYVFYDYKTVLQEVVQQAGECKISYEVVAEYGPDHNKTFEVSVLVNHQHLGAGSGKNKKEAEQNAAKEALQKLKKLNSLD